MDRRKFLMGSASFIAGSLLGLNRLPRAFAFEQEGVPSCFVPRIALIIDDIGFSPYRARKFLELGIPITFSILPCLQKSRDLAVEVHENGHEVMLHQPMEPYDLQINPGPGALYRGFSADAIVGILEENIASVPFAVGVNNHMGSKFTECPKEVRDVLRVLNQEGLFFIDSLTTNHSKAYETARELHIPTACRNRFLDNVPDESAIHLQLHNLIQWAFRYGSAIGIGHPHPETASAIGRFLPEFERAGVSLVYASQVLTTPKSEVDKTLDVSVFGDYT